MAKSEEVKKSVKKTEETKAKKAVPAVKKTSEKKAEPKTASVKAAKTTVKVQTDQKTAVKAEAKKTVRKAPVKKATAKTPAMDLMNDTLRGESKKFEIEDRRGYYEPSYETQGEKTYILPEEYGDTRLTLLVQDPYWVHAYWEINEASRKRFGLEKSKHQKDLTIRIYHAVTNQYFDIQVSDTTRNWYFNIPEANKYYYSEIGLLESGRFLPIVRSNTILVPSDKAAGIIGQAAGAAGIEGTFAGDEAARELYKQSGGYVIHKLVGSQVVSEWGGSSAMGSSGGVSSHVSSGSGGMQLNQPMKKRGFWAELHTELIVYGATEPDAKVTVGGVPTKLTKDGKFSIRFYLKDGDHPVPFIATSSDNIDTIEITPHVSKRTERKERKN